MDDRYLQAKALVWEYWQQCRGRSRAAIQDTLGHYLSADTVWHGCQPWNSIRGRVDLAREFWAPLFRSFPDLVKEPCIFMGGEFRGDYWVSGTGHYRGTFESDWLGIPATDREASIRFGEFCLVRDGRIVDSRVILDIPDLMRQAGFVIFPPATGEEGFSPGPSADDGIISGGSDPETTRRSLKLVEDMIAGLSRYDGSGDFSGMNQKRFWTSGMRWYGPHGIGSTRGLDGFEKHHQRPFLEGFPDRKGGNHICRHADGLFVASTGWPSIRAHHHGPYLGIEPTGRAVTMRVMDWWRVDGGLLGENWVFIDMIDLVQQLGVDPFEALTTQIGARNRA